MGNEFKKKVDEYGGNTLISLSSPFLENEPSIDVGNILKNPKRILLIKFWGIGNLVMLTPTIKAIRKKFPNSKIYFLTLSKNKGLLENLNYVDKVLYHELGPMDTIRIANLVSKYHRKFDIVIDFEQFLNISSIITYFLGKYRIGFSNRTRARHKLYNSFKPCNESKHIVEQFYDLCGVVGLPKRRENLKIDSFDFIDKNEGVDSFLVKNRIAIDKKRKKNILIGVHIGSSGNAKVKRWPKNYFIEMINLLNKKTTFLQYLMLQKK